MNFLSSLSWSEGNILENDKLGDSCSKHVSPGEEGWNSGIIGEYGEEETVN